MAVRSKLLAHGTLTTAAVTAYTCPGGETALIKHVTFFNPTTGAITTPFIAMVIAGASRGLLRLPNVAVGDTVHASQLFIVMPPGATLTVQTNPASAVQYTISGAELEGVAD